MSAPARIMVIFVIALFVLLPLHELVDIGEQWPYDGNLVLVVLSTIFLAGLAILCRGVAHACLESLRRVLIPACAQSAPAFRARTCTRDRSQLFLTHCLLRI